MDKILKHEKTVVCEGLKTRSKVFKKTSNGSIMIDCNNYYLSKEDLINHVFEKSSDSSVESGEIEDDNALTSNQEYFLSRFQSASTLWKDKFLNIPDMENRSERLNENLAEIPWNTHGINEKLVLDKKWAEEVRSMRSTNVTVGPELLKDPVTESGLLSDWLTNLKGSITNLNNFIHFPMILCERSADESLERPIISADNHIRKLICSASFSQTEKSYMHLSTMERQARTSSKVDKGDFSNPKFNDMDRAALANRGVQAKTLSKKRKSILISKDKSLSPNLDTTELERYLCSPFVINNRENCSLEYDLDEGNNCSFTCDWVNCLSRIEEFQALEFHDKVIAEVVANSTRNVDTDVFIVRKIMGYRAYVIIKPTSLGSVNDPKPIFYSLVFRGKSINKIYEPVFTDESGWSYTDFISTSRIRASHHMNSMPQFMMMVFENLETLSMLKEDPEMDLVQAIVEPIKWCMLAHIQDKEEFSSNVSNFRYYYFSLFSGFANCKDEAEQLQTKLPSVIRDPLTLLALRRLIHYHNDLDADEISQQTSILSSKRIQEETADALVVDDSEYDKLPEIATPFGFKIDNSRSFLKAAYMSIYHNKDEAEKGPAAKQIVSKLCGQEKHMTKLLESDDTPQSYCTDIGESLGIYRFNMHALTLGTDLIKCELLDQCGIPKDDFRRSIGFDDWIENCIIIPTFLKTTYDELATTRSSFVDNGDIEINKYKKSKGGKSSKKSSKSDKTVIGQTIKCIEGILHLRNNGVATGISPCDDVHKLISEFEKDGSKLTIKIFKKNQLTGVREIYILTIVGRLLQRLIEDLARGICKKLHQEKLTGPETKDSFVYEHKVACAHKSRDKKSVTINGSGDKTQWANYLHPKALTFPLFRLIPEKYHALIAHVGNANTKKEIEIPSSLIESMLKYPETDLENPVLNEIKGSVLSGDKSTIASYNSSRLRCRGNTMQGICHYMSSLYHMCALMLLSTLIEKYIMDMSYEPHISFEVSSDDKGFMVTIFVDENIKINMLKLTIETTRYMRYLERVIDSAFGIRDSRLKSVTTISVSFEFNSVFYFGNSITTPIAKFTSRCCDDTMQSTLHNRVSSMFSSVRQIRDNGGSGILCSLATMAQHIVMKSNLGFKNFSWFDSYAISDYNSLKLSHTGYRRICNPITAGLTMSDYENIKYVNENRLGNAYRLLLRRDLDSEDLPEQIVLSTIFWARDKHKSMLLRVGLQEHEMTESESLLILGSPKTPDEMTTKIKLMASSSSLSRSFVQCQRSDLLRAGMYLLWHKGFRIDDEKVNFRTLIRTLLDKERSDYPMNSNYESYQRLEKQSRFYALRNRRARLMPRYFKPLVNHSYVRDDVIKYMRHIWMNDPDCPEDYLVDQIKQECTWITDQPSDFFNTYDPVMLHRFINSVPTRKTKMKLLTRGNNTDSNVIACMMKDNTSADATLISRSGIGTDSEIRRLKEISAKTSCRISRWVDVLCLTLGAFEARMYCYDDLVSISKDFPEACKAYCGSRQERLCAYLMSCIRDNKEISTLECFKLGTSDYLCMKLASDPRCRYTYEIHLGCPVLTRNVNGNYTDICCYNPEVLSIIGQYGKFSSASRNTMDMDYRFIIDRVDVMQSSLAIGNHEVTIGGFIGVPSSYLVMEDKLIDKTRSLSQISFECLKVMIECPNEVSEDIYNYIITDSSVMCKALCCKIGMMEKQRSYPKICKSTDIRQDSEIPPSSNLDKKIRHVVETATTNEFLNFIDLIQQDNISSDSEEEVISDDHDAFLDMYGEDLINIIPGVVQYDVGFKNSTDRLQCLEKLVHMISSNRPDKLTMLNRPVKDVTASVDKWCNEFYRNDRRFN